MRARALILACLVAAGCATSGPQQRSVVDVMTSVAEWQLANPSKHPPNEWQQAPFWIALNAFAPISKDPQRYRDAVRRNGETNRWQPGPHPFNADDHAIIQSYFMLHEVERDRRMIEPSLARFDQMLRNPFNESLEFSWEKTRREWVWCDALFMSPPSLALATHVTSDRRYIDLMNRLWWKTTDYLYDKNERLYYRDSRFLGQRVFWSRGNGWVLAGLARVLQVMPVDYPERPRYVALFREMAGKIATLQSSDGYWRSNLLEPDKTPAPETSGTAFFTYALAWGVNEGILDRGLYEPVVLRGWNALVRAVHPNGMLGYVQRVGDQPGDVTSDDTEIYGVGAFLLAGAESGRLARSGRGGPPALLGAGFRYSAYGPEYNPGPEYWALVGVEMARKFPGAVPETIWIVSKMHGQGTQLNFPVKARDPLIVSSPADENEATLNLFDRLGYRVWLQIEPGFASVTELIDVILERYKHHPSVIGFGIDVEWYRSSNPDEGQAVTDAEAKDWLAKIRKHNPNYRLFLKHFQQEKMPPTFREGLLLVDDSQILPSLEAMVDEFAQWGKRFAPAPVAFQYGYPSDRPWWSKLPDPPRDIGRAILARAPNTEGLYWVDFTVLDVFPPVAERKPVVERKWTKFENLAITPPMGWNSWNRFGCNVDEGLIRRTADAMVASGMKEAGYLYINIDDCWHGERDEQGFIKPDPQRFPSGMRALADFVHSKGLKFGIYSDAGWKTCGGRPGSRGRESQDAKTYAEWGVDYLKYDWCDTDGLSAEGAYLTMSQALRAAGRPVVLSICEWGENQPWRWGKTIGHLWRTSGDITNCFDCVVDHGTWKSWGVVQIIDRQSLFGLRRFAGPDHWNDPDMLEVGNGMSAAEDRAHFSMWAMMAAPLIAGNDLTTMSKETVDILTNRDVIAVNQDPLGIQGYRHRVLVGSVEVWVKPLSGGDWAIAFLNRTTTPYTTNFDWTTPAIADSLSKRKLEGVYEIRDFWAKQARGDTSANFQAEIPPHDVIMLRLKEKGR